MKGKKSGNSQQNSNSNNSQTQDKMKTIVVHYNTSTIEITPPSTSTWGQLAQRFCEHSLLHPPKLLQLLTSLSSQQRMSCYQLRFGDGYATIVKPTWNNSIASTSDEDGGMMIEANVTFKSRGKGPLSKVNNLPQAIIPDKPNVIDVDLFIELVGLASIDVDLPMTQTPFPVDETKTNILYVKEHPQFEGVVDKFSIEKKTGGPGRAVSVTVAAPVAVAAVGGAAGSTTVIMSGKKRKENPSTIKDVKTPTAKEGGDKTKKKKKAKIDKTNKDKNSVSSTKSKKTANNDNNPPAAVSSSPEKKSTAPASSPAKKSPPKKAAATPAASSTTKKSSSKKKAAAATPTKKTADKVESSGEALSSGQKKAKPTTTAGEEVDGNDLKEEKSGKEDEVQIPKRPPNGYMRFSCEVRSKIVEENPGLKVTEVAKKIGKAYNDLTKDEKNKYQEEARIALVKFKAEHPNLPKSVRKKKKKKNKKNGEEKKDDEVIAKEGAIAAVEKEEGVEDHDEEGVDKKKDMPKQKKKKNKKNGEGKEDNEVIAKEVAIAAVEKAEGVEDHDGEEEEVDKKDRPKRPLNAYMLFANEVRSTVKEDNPDAKPKDVMILVGKAYRKLDESEKDQYRIVADAAMKNFKEEHGEDALRNKPRKSKKKKKLSGNNSGGSHSTEDNLALIPSKPAEGFPDGWVTRNVPRKSGDRSDMYWFSPAKSFKFRSKAQVKRFQSNFEKSGGDEDAAMELYTKGEKKEKNAVAADGSEKKRKRNSGKKKDAAVADGHVEEEEVPEVWGV